MPVDLSAWGGKVKATDMLSGASESGSAGANVKLGGESGRALRIERTEGSAAQ